MEAWISPLILVAIVVATVVAAFWIKGQERVAPPPPKQPYVRPKPLTPEQRKALRLPEPQRSISPPAAIPFKTITPKPASSRAIQRGWSIGMVEFTYEDSNGDISYRTVTVHSVTRTYLKGECHDRQAERTFRLDRIIGDLTDCNTGELMSPDRWAMNNK